MKKFIYIVLVSMLVFTGIQSVSADDKEMLEGIASQFNKQNVTINYKDCADKQGKITAKYNESGTKGIIITCNGSEQALIALAYKDTDQSLTFTQNGSQDDINSDSESLFIIMDNILEAFLVQNGYEKMALPSDFGEGEDFKLSINISQAPIKDPFIREGIVLERKGAISYLKMSLEKDKIDAFVNEKGDKYIRSLMETTPTLASNSVTSSSVSLTPTVEGTYDDNYKAKCYLYRSNQQNDGYSIVSTVDNCLNGATIKDNNLSADTTYYYKIQLVGSNNISEPIAMTTSDSLVDPDQNVTPDVNPNNNTVIDNGNVTPDTGKENPNTGTFIPSVILSLFAIGSVGTLIYTNNKNRFKNY